jgi:hypothetical protein
MRILRWLAVISLALPATVRADDHRADINGNLSPATASTLLGFQVTFAKPIPGYERWSVLADYSHHWDLEDDLSERRATYMSGLRYTVPVADHTSHKVFVQTLLGLGHTTLNGSGDSDLAWALGGGWEHIWDRGNMDARAKGLPLPKKHAHGVRAQVDYIIAQGDTKNFTRFSVGYVLRFEKSRP